MPSILQFYTVQSWPRSPKPTRSTYLQRPQTDIETDPNLKLTLFRLPREIFDEVVTYLPAPTKVCLALSCKAAAHTLGPWTTACFLSQGNQIRDRTFDRTLRPFAARPSRSTSVQSLPIDLFTGEFTTQLRSLDYHLLSSARWIGRGLVLKQEHRLRSSTGSLQSIDVTTLAFHICAHLSTTTSPPPTRRHTKRQDPNGPLLTHAISTAFPRNFRRGIAGPKTFRPPSPAEQAQITASAHNKGYIWRCRSCPTKFRVEYCSSNNRLDVTEWYFFGKELYKALEYWKMFVRREGTTLGPKTRNSEFYVVSRGIPDFAIEATHTLYCCPCSRACISLGSWI